MDEQHAPELYQILTRQAGGTERRACALFYGLQGEGGEGRHKEKAEEKEKEKKKKENNNDKKKEMGK